MFRECEEGLLHVFDLLLEDFATLPDMRVHVKSVKSCKAGPCDEGKAPEQRLHVWSHASFDSHELPEHALDTARFVLAQDFLTAVGNSADTRPFSSNVGIEQVPIDMQLALCLFSGMCNGEALKILRTPGHRLASASCQVEDRSKNSQSSHERELGEQVADPNAPGEGAES